MDSNQRLPIPWLNLFQLNYWTNQQPLRIFLCACCGSLFVLFVIFNKLNNMLYTPKVRQINMRKFSCSVIINLLTNFDGHPVSLYQFAGLFYVLLYSKRVDFKLFYLFFATYCNHCYLIADIFLDTVSEFVNQFSMNKSSNVKFNINYVIIMWQMETNNVCTKWNTRPNT